MINVPIVKLCFYSSYCFLELVLYERLRYKRFHTQCRSLSSHFILPRRERPMLAEKPSCRGTLQFRFGGNEELLIEILS